MLDHHIEYHFGLHFEFLQPAHKAWSQMVAAFGADDGIRTRNLSIMSR